MSAYAWFLLLSALTTGTLIILLGRKLKHCLDRLMVIYLGDDDQAE